MTEAVTTTQESPYAGRVGVWTGALDAVPVDEVPDQLAALEEQGWSSLWFGEAYGREAFTNAAMLLGATSRLTIGTGIASVYARDPMAAAGAARLLNAQHPGRFVLGLGISHAPLVERMRGHAYGKPIATMREFVEKLHAAPHYAAGRAGGEPAAGRAGGDPAAGRAGEDLAAGAAAGAPPDLPPVMLAALGPKMLALAAELTDGAHPYLGTPEHTAGAREALGPDKRLVVEQGVVLSDDADVVRERAHWHLEIYTGLPNYRNNWLRLGFDEADLVRGGSDRLKQALVVGGASAIAERVRAHLDAGADEVLVQVLGANAADVPTTDWERLAPVLVL